MENASGTVRFALLIAALCVFAWTAYAASIQIAVSGPANSIVDAGQYENFTVNVVVGTGPFTYNFLVFNSFTDSIIASAYYSGVVSTSNTFLWMVPASAAGNTIDANVLVSNSTSSAYSDFLNNLETNTIALGAGSTPFDVAFNSSGALAYVTDQGTGTVSVINASTNTVVNTINVGSEPFGVAFNNQGTMAYVANEGDNNVSVIDVAESNAVNSVDVGSTPFDVAVDPQGTLAYVTNAGGDTVSVVDLAENATVNTVNVGNEPFEVAFSPSGTFAYVDNLADGTVSVIDVAENESVGLINVGNDPEGVAFDPDGTVAYVTNSGDDTVSVISAATNTVVDTINVGGSPVGVAFSPSGLYAYVVNDGSDNVSVIDVASNAVVGTGNVGGSPVGVAFSPSGTFAYVTNSNDDNVSVIETPFFKVSVYPQLSTPAVYESSQDIESGQSVAISSSWIGGAPNYTASLYSSATSSCNTGSTLVQTEAFLASNSFEFNPVTLTSSTYFCVFVTDNATTPVTENSINGFVNVYPMPLAVSISPPSNLIVSAGQYEAFTAVVSGGTEPYTYNFIISNSVTGTPVASAVYTGISSQQYNSTLRVPSWTAGFMLQANVVVTDSNGNTANSIPSTAPIVTGNINVNTTQLYFAISPSGKYAYLPNGNQITVVNLTTNLVENVIKIPNSSDLTYVAFSPSGAFAYVSDYTSGNVIVINTATDSIANTINVGGLPFVIATNPYSSLIYVTNQETPDSSVQIINPNTYAVVNTISASDGTLQGYIAINPSGTLAYVDNDGGYNLSIINLTTNAIVNSISVGQYPFWIAFNPSGTLAYLSSDATNNVSVINTATNTVVNTINVGLSPQGIAINPSGTLGFVVNYCYMGCGTEGSVDVIDLASNEVVNTLVTNPFPVQIGLNPSGTEGYITSTSSDNLTVISIQSNITVTPPTITISQPSNNIITAGQYETFTATVVNGTPPFTFNFFAFNSVTKHRITSAVYTDIDSSSLTATFQIPSSAGGNTIQVNVTASDDNGITESSGPSPSLGIVNTILLGYSIQGPTDIAFNKSGALFYLANYANNNISVFNTSTYAVVNTINVFADPYCITLNPNGTEAYVCTHSALNENISVINTETNTIVNTINAGSDQSGPEQILFNHLGSLAYALNECSDYSCLNNIGNVNVIDTSTNSIAYSIVVGVEPTYMSLNPSGSLLYVVNYCGSDPTCSSPGTISIINTTTYDIVNTINVGYFPQDIAFNPSGTLAYLTSCGNDPSCSTPGNVSVINTSTNTILQNVTVGYSPTSIELNPSGTFAYVLNICGSGSACDNSTLSLIDTSTDNVVANALTNVTGFMALNPSATLAYLISGFYGGPPYAVYVLSTSPYIAVNPNVTPTTSTTTLTTTIPYCTGICGSGGSGVSSVTTSTTPTTTLNTSTTTALQTTVPPVTSASGSGQSSSSSGSSSGRPQINSTSVSATHGVYVARNGPSCLSVYNISSGSAARIIINNYTIVMRTQNVSSGAIALSLNNRSYDLQIGVPLVFVGSPSQEFNFTLLNSSGGKAGISLCTQAVQSPTVPGVPGVSQIANVLSNPGEIVSSPIPLLVAVAIVAVVLYELYRLAIHRKIRR